MGPRKSKYQNGYFSGISLVCSLGRGDFRGNKVFVFIKSWFLKKSLFIFNSVPRLLLERLWLHQRRRSLHLCQGDHSSKKNVSLLKCTQRHIYFANTYAFYVQIAILRTAPTAQIREQQLLREQQQIREQQQQLDFEEINLFSALFIVVCLSSEPFHISRPSAIFANSLPSTRGSRFQGSNLLETI